jgi:ADP-ribosyl-[dinitrogen reductase] hydrolase
MWRAREGAPAQAIRPEIAARFGYLDRSVDAIRPRYRFDETCDGTVPEALICAFEADDCEDAVRNAVSLGGDADTLACITGGLAEALFGLPEDLAEQAREFSIRSCSNR